MRIKCLAQGENILMLGLNRQPLYPETDILTTILIYSYSVFSLIFKRSKKTQNLLLTVAVNTTTMKCCNTTIKANIQGIVVLINVGIENVDRIGKLLKPQATVKVKVTTVICH